MSFYSSVVKWEFEGAGVVKCREFEGKIWCNGLFTPNLGACPFARFFFEKSRSNVGEKHRLTKDWCGGFMNPPQRGRVLMCICIRTDPYPDVSITATHCNTLQHTATHCNTLQHTATHCKHCNTLQHTASHCITPYPYKCMFLYILIPIYPYPYMSYFSTYPYTFLYTTHPCMSLGTQGYIGIWIWEICTYIGIWI